MKKVVIVFSVILLTQQITQAQGTVYLSNLGQSFPDSNPVASDSWLAASFITGNNAGGYLLDSFELGMANATGNPSGFTVMLYSATGTTGVFPGNSLGTLTGSLSPISAGTYTYIPGSSLALSPSTWYFMVLTAGTAIANGAYEWNYTSTFSYNPSGGWFGVAVTIASNDGSSWFGLGSSPNYDYSEIAITATPVPEPSAFSFWLAGASCFVGQRCWRKFH